MTMRTASPFRSPCEVLRKINDLCQGNNEKDNEIRQLLSEAMKKTKYLNRALAKLDPSWWQNQWEANKNFHADAKRRLNDNYLQGYSKGEIGKVAKDKS